MAVTTMQGLTPTISIIVPNDVDLTEAENVYPSIKQNNTLIIPATFDVSEHQCDIYLSQEETLRLEQGRAEIQVNWVFSTGQRCATVPQELKVMRNHILEVLT